MGLLVIRASVEEGPRRTLLVQVLEVTPTSPDRIIGIVSSSAAASRLVGQWLDALAAEEKADRTPQRSADGER
jgi:hypothetical protein